MKVLITGGTGYIGSTIASACADAGHQPVILEDLSRGSGGFRATLRPLRGRLRRSGVGAPSLRRTP